jgi:hypothetical protein
MVLVLVLATMTMTCRVLELLLQTQNLQACLSGPVSRLTRRLTCLRELPIPIGNLPPAPPARVSGGRERRDGCEGVTEVMSKWCMHE